VLSSGSTNLKDLKAGTYKLERFCMEPTAFSVKEESQFKGGETNFVATKLMTRLTYTLDGVSARCSSSSCCDSSTSSSSNSSSTSSSRAAVAIAAVKGGAAWAAGAAGAAGAAAVVGDTSV
jgi:hypothetical protein